MFNKKLSWQLADSSSRKGLREHVERRLQASTNDSAVSSTFLVKDAFRREQKSANRQNWHSLTRRVWSLCWAGTKRLSSGETASASLRAQQLSWHGVRRPTVGPSGVGFCLETSFADRTSRTLPTTVLHKADTSGNSSAADALSDGRVLGFQVVPRVCEWYG